MAKHAFLSFVVEDKSLADMFRGQAKNKKSDLEFDDYSVQVAFDSKDAEYIRGRIAEKIKNASITICLIGEDTYKSRWVAWEIKKSEDLGNRLLGVRLHSAPKDTTPKALTDAKGTVLNWDIDKIVAFIDED